MARLTHFDETGRPRMVDISEKAVTRREAVARGAVRMTEESLRVISESSLPKGDVLTVARIAGIQAAKRTSELIPLCHPLPITLVEVTCALDRDLPGIVIESRVKCDARTGAEMEALTAVAVAALTIIDMAKSADPWMTIERIELVEKRGGKSGERRRPQHLKADQTVSMARRGMRR
jgi:cyclic pyranopterin phosphate synthase